MKKDAISWDCGEMLRWCGWHQGNLLRGIVIWLGAAQSVVQTSFSKNFSLFQLETKPKTTFYKQCGFHLEKINLRKLYIYKTIVRY
jgi:hypothetical protein